MVPVVIDPILAMKLRPHQIEGSGFYGFHRKSDSDLPLGIKFMYECVMGIKHDGKGCILADEMYVLPLYCPQIIIISCRGMGKTLQVPTPRQQI